MGAWGGGKRSGVRVLQPAVKAIDTRTVPVEPKQVDPFYLTLQYEAWRKQVISNAGFRCQVVEGGKRCPKASPGHRMFADHIQERRDGGAPYDPANGMCLCGSHHTLKTARARAARHSAS